MFEPTNDKILVGIDPGINGGICFADGDISIVSVHRMPIVNLKGKKEIYLQAVVQLLQQHALSHVFIEKQQSMPRQGVSSVFKTGYGYGALIGLLVGLQIPFTPVSPLAWKKAMQVPSDKNAARAIASNLFPLFSKEWQLIRDDGLAEAALIVEYGRRHVYKK